MISLLLKRSSHGLLVLWVVATLTFLLLRLAPGGPFDSERKLPPEVIANLEAKYHLDEPMWQQYLRYLGGIVQGDLGPSYKYLDRGVTEIIADTLPTSVVLGGLAMVFAVLDLLSGRACCRLFSQFVIDRYLYVSSPRWAFRCPISFLGALLIWAVALQLGLAYKSAAGTTGRA